MSSSYPLTKLYIAKFSSKTSRRDIEDLFSKYGDLYGCKLNEREGYATVTYKYPENAEKAIAKLNNTDILGGNLLVEHTLKKSRNENSYRYEDKYRDGRNDYRSSRYDRDRDYQSSSRREPPFRFDKEKFIKGGLCFNCSEKGHVARDCPDAKQGIYRGKTYNGDRYRRNSYNRRSRSRSGDRKGGYKRSNSRDSRDKKRRYKHSRRSRSSSYSRSESNRRDRIKQKKGKSRRSSSTSSSKSRSKSKSKSRSESKSDSRSRSGSRSVQKKNNNENTAISIQKKQENGKSRSESIDGRQ